VTGAQRAFSDTFSRIITNIVTLTLTLVVMLRISWQVTLLSLLLMPMFLLPRRWIGRPWRGFLARREPQRDDEHPDDRTVFAPGATLVKLFGNPATESREFEVRADVSAISGPYRDAAVGLHELADADVGAGAGPCVRARRCAGDRRRLADGCDRVTGTAVTRLYSPLTSLANAHVEIASALVSFERVFEVLDLMSRLRRLSRLVEPAKQRAICPTCHPTSRQRHHLPRLRQRNACRNSSPHPVVKTATSSSEARGPCRQTGRANRTPSNSTERAVRHGHASGFSWMSGTNRAPRRPARN